MTESTEKKKRGRPRKSKKIEYENVTQGTIAYVDVFDTTTGRKIIKGKAIHPQSSDKNPKVVYFTPEEEEMNKINSPHLFLEGILRPVDAEIRDLRVLKPTDDMAIVALKKYIEITNDIEKFEKEIKVLNSLNTLALFEQYVTEANKTIDFYTAIQNRKIAVTKDKEL